MSSHNGPLRGCTRSSASDRRSVAGAALNRWRVGALRDATHVRCGPRALAVPGPSLLCSPARAGCGGGCGEAADARPRRARSPRRRPERATRYPRPGRRSASRSSRRRTRRGSRAATRSPTPPAVALRRLSRAHARVAPGRGDPRRGRATGGPGSPPSVLVGAADRARRSCSPTATSSRTATQGRAGRAAADRLQGGGRRAGHPRRDEGAGRRATRRPTSPRREPGRAGGGGRPAADGRGRQRRPTRSSSPPPDQPEYAMPAAGWAAKSGDPVLWVSANGVPPETDGRDQAAQAGRDLRPRAGRRGAPTPCVDAARASSARSSGSRAPTR